MKLLSRVYHKISIPGFAQILKDYREIRKGGTNFERWRNPVQQILQMNSKRQLHLLSLNHSLISFASSI